MILPYGFAPLNPEMNVESQDRNLWAKKQGNFFLEKTLQQYDRHDETPESGFIIHYILVGTELITVERRPIL